MTLGPTEVLTKDNVKVRWGERYTSDALNKKFLGIPRGVYLGFAPQASGLVLSLIPDRSITLVSPSTTAFAINDVVTGGTTATNAPVLAISSGFVLIGTPSGGTGSFIAGETITAAPSGASATVGSYTNEAISFARVVSGTPLVPGRSEGTIDLITGDTVTLDFTGFSNGTYYVFATGSYAVGSATVGSVASRTAPPPNGMSEVLICLVTKVGLNLTIQSTSPATRQEPFATAGSRIGFMPGGAIDSLLAAVATTNEVAASRVDTSGTKAPDFNPSLSMTTGLPERLTADFSRAATAARLGKQVVIVQSNDVDPVTFPSLVITDSAKTGTASTVYNISGSFAARTRSNQPVKDDTTGDLLGQTLTLTTIVGTFSVGETVSGGNGTTAIIQSVSGSTISVYDIVGFGFTNGEQVTGVTSAATGVISASPAGIRIPISIRPNGSDVVTLTVSNAISTGTIITGDTSGAQGVVRSGVGTTLDVDQLFGIFREGEPLNGGISTISSVDHRIGAITAAADGSSGDTVRNVAAIFETASGRKPVDSSGNPVYGRILFGPNGAAGATGSGGGPGELLVANSPGQAIAFSVGGITDVFANIDFTKYFVPGDLIEGADGRFYEISPAAGSVTSTSITLTAGKPYLGSPAQAGVGATGSGAVPVARRRRRYLLKPVVRSGGAETATTITIGTNTPTGAQLQTLFPAWLTHEQSNFDASFAKSAPCDGVFVAKSDGSDTTPGHLVQTNDVRLGSIKAKGSSGGGTGSGGPTGLEPLVNMIAGSGIEITVAEVAGQINVTIKNASPGVPGATGGTTGQMLSPSVSPGGSNSAGSSGNFAPIDHVHAAPTYPTLRHHFDAATSSSIQSGTVFQTSPSFAPQIGICFIAGGENNNNNSVGVFDGTGTGNQFFALLDGGNDNFAGNGYVWHTNSGIYGDYGIKVTQFGAGASGLTLTLSQNSGGPVAPANYSTVVALFSVG